MYLGEKQMEAIDGADLNTARYGLLRILIDGRDNVGTPGDEAHDFPGCVVAASIPRTGDELPLGTPRGFYSLEQYAAEFATGDGFAANARSLARSIEGKPLDGALLVSGNRIVANQAKMGPDISRLLVETGKSYGIIRSDGLKGFYEIFVKDPQEETEYVTAERTNPDRTTDRQSIERRSGVRTDAVVATAMQLTVSLADRFAFDQAMFALKDGPEPEDLPADVRRAIAHKAPVLSMGQTRAPGGRGQRLSRYGANGILDRIEYIGDEKDGVSLVQAVYGFIPPGGVRVVGARRLDEAEILELCGAPNPPEELPGENIPITSYLFR